MTRSIHTAAIIAVVIVFFCLSMLAQAAVPSSLNYQGYLTDTDGSPIDDDVVVTFSIYTTDLDGTFIWTDTELVTVDQGLFSVELGADNPFPPDLFETPLWLGVTVDGDAEMLPRRPLTTVGFAFQSNDALSLQGQTAAAFDQAAHVADMSNPHGVDAAQAGAATSTDITSLQAQLDAALATIATLQADLAAETTARIASDDAEAATRMAADNAEQAARMAADSVQDSVITGIQANSVLALDGVLTRPDSETALFTAVNVQVVSGSGTTNGSINGLGNLIVGYNAPRPSGSDNSGSHNLVVGDNHNYNSYGGLVAGYQNTISDPFASVSAGFDNTASGLYSSVTGGSGNTASHLYASVSAGLNNAASGNYASVTGGYANTASNLYASVSGGYSNTASGLYASVSGGSNNVVQTNFAIYQIGDTGPAGGLVFFVNDSGTHGLEAAPADTGVASWGCDGVEIRGADGQGIYYGNQNTRDILAHCPTPDIAADIARDYSLNGFNDWFLPSKDELNLMYLNLHRAGLGGFVDTDYRTSSEIGSGSAWIQGFNDGYQGGADKSYDRRVRAVRAF